MQPPSAVVDSFVALARHLPLVLLTPAGSVLAATEAGAEALGCRASEVVGRRWQDLCTDAPEGIDDYLRQCARTLHPIPGSFHRVVGDEITRFRCDGHLALLPDAPERLLVLRVRRQAEHDAFVLLGQKVEELNTEIGRRKESEKKLAEALARETEAQNRLRLILDEMPAGVVIAEAPSARIVFANRQAQQLFGGPLRADDAADYPAQFKAWHDDGREYGVDDYTLVRAVRGELVRQEVTFRRSDGERLTVYLNAAPIRSASGTIVAAIASYFDITEQKRLERLAEAARAETEAASRAKDEFLAMLGHELRNPLAPISTALHLMELGDVGGHKEREVIQRQVEHLERLVDDLLDISRITGARIEIERHPLEIEAVAARAIEMVSPLLEKRRMHLEVSVPSQGLLVRGDSARLAQVVSNLLNNAIKYSDDGARVWLEAARDGEEVALVVRDEGVGIEPEILPRIFDLFVQERQALDRSRGGLGVGLAIVRGIVDLHGGSVSVRSDGRGLGAEFTVRLPCATAASTAASSASADRVSARRASNALRILVVDDNQDAAEMLCAVLQRRGHTAELAHDGPTALRIAGDFAPEVALLDIGLPVMDGYELAGHLRALPALGGVRLVAITGYGQESDRRRSERAGFDAHLVKPVGIRQLDALLQEISQSLSRQSSSA